MPDPQDLAARRAKLSPAQRATLAQRLRGDAVSAPQQTIPRLSHDSPIPLSFAQQRQWFLWRMNPESTAYHLCGGLAFAGRLDVEVLCASLQALVARHESLRTTFQENSEGLVEQIIHGPVPVDLPCIDLCALDAEERTLRLHSETERICKKPFDLKKGPLLRAVLLKYKVDEYRLIVVMHHIISDAQSTQIILEEMAILYRAHLEGAAPPLPPLPIRCADHAAWQREWLSGADGERQLAWWQKQLGDEQPVIALHTDHRRKVDGHYRAARHRIDLPSALLNGLRRQTTAQGGTLFTALLAAFDALLFRYTHQTDLRIGVPIAGRNRAEVQGIVGFFVNTQVLRARVDERIPLNELLAQTRAVAFDAQANPDVPFERLVEVLRPERSLGSQPLFQVMFNHLRMDSGSLGAWPRLTVQRLDFDEAEAQFELTLQTSELGDGRVEICFIYADELFEAATIERMARHYIKVLQALAEQPDQRVGEIELLTEPERQQLTEWGVNSRRYPDLEPVHRLIERQVQVQPNALALIFNDEHLSYAELNTRANRLAHYLIKLGVKPEAKVGIAVERSIEMVVGLLAILKAGGAYVPLDPEYPQERLAYMIDDSGIDLLLTQRQLIDALPLQERLRVLALGDLDLSGESEENPQVDLHGESLAYVIYTSGSTGKPKGAANRHIALTNRLQWMQDAYRLTAADTVLQKTPFSFDVSVWEFFWPLMTGAQLVMVQPGDHRDPARLVELITTHDVAILHFVPSMLQAFLGHEGIEVCESLQRIVCSGEALSVEAQKAVFRRLPQVALYNLYGPTEAAIDVTHWTCRDDDQTQVPIGQPISGIQTWVLDQGLNPVPQGVAGELFLGGAGLARGYLHRAGLSAERFVADPFDEQGGRLYRTGDLVRWNTGGQLEYLGRIDHQVKIRGFRIELGEIEAQLLSQPEIREAVVVASESPSGARLVGYVSEVEGQVANPAQLRECLNQTLPDYMVPSAIVVLEALPLNANGKVDRKALPEPEMAISIEYEPPEGKIEEILAGIWAEVLGVERVGRHDNFFELGGHSLMATMLTSRVRAAIGLDLPLRKVFERPSLQRLAACIEGLQSVEPLSVDREVPLLAVSRQAATSLPLSPAQQRLWLVDRMAGVSAAPAYNMAAALRLSGLLDLPTLQATLDTILARHEALRTTYPEDDEGYPMTLVHKASPMELPLTDLSHESAGEQRHTVEQTLGALAAQPFNLTQGPLLRASLLRLDSEEHVLLLCVHHIVFDGWSEAIFVKEFVTLYQALRAGVVPTLPELAIQYSDYAVWQHSRLEASARRDANFWCAYLDNAPVLSTLPADCARETRASTFGAAMSMEINGEVMEAVNRLAKVHETSIFTVLLASFTAWLHQLTGADDLVIGTDVAGRNHPRLEDLIGFFVNVVPLRSRWSAGVTFSQWLERIKETSLSAFEHQEVPFDQIIDYAKVRRSRGSNPLVQVLFVMQNTPRNHFSIPDLEVEVLPAPATTSKFDVAVFVSEKPEGLSVEWVFATDLYRRETIERTTITWRELLQYAVGAPETPLYQLVRSGIGASLVEDTPLPKADKLDKLKKIVQRETSSVPVARQLVRTSFLGSGREFPLVVEATSTDIDAIAWARTQRHFVEASLRKHAAILFRNFGLKTPQEFESFAEAVEPQLHGSYGDLPKKEGGRNIYRSTPYPERQMILYHNESSHLERWPRKQWFFCELPSRAGGATPIVDCREMLSRLPSGLVDEFESKGLLYVRTFVPRLDVSWQDFFKTDSRTDVETRLEASGIGWRWLDEQTLQTRTRCPAVIRHPHTGQRVFFNQMQLHHVHCLEPEVREDLLNMVGVERMPRQVYYGDGSPISDETMAVIGKAYEVCAVRFDWRQGDVLMLDNMLAAHARDPYEEPRKIVVAMGDMVDREVLVEAGLAPVL